MCRDDCHPVAPACAHPLRDPSTVSRREFVSRSTLAAVAAVLAGSCGTGADILGLRNGAGGGAGLGPGGVTLRLADYPALAQVGGIARADTAAGPIAVVRTASSSFAAFSMICPHQGSTIDIGSGGFVCPNHGARFSASGQWTGGQRTTNLVAYIVAYDAVAGTLTIGADPSGVSPVGQPGATAVSLVVDLAAFPELAVVGGVARVDGGTGTPVGAARTSATQFVAYALSCTHQGATVRLTGSGWTCPNHGAQFSASGAVTRGPAVLPLTPLSVAYDPAANRLTITGSAPTRRGGDDDDHDG